MFYALSASIGLMREILFPRKKLDSRPILIARANIGNKLKILNEKLKPSDNDLPISTLAIKEITTSSKEAIINETKH